jgi:hypothetical protein
MKNRNQASSTRTIVCPTWCQTPMQEHLDDIDLRGPRAIHYAARSGNGWRVDSASHTFLDGTPDEGPQLDVSFGHQSQMSTADARALAQALLEACEELES